MSSGKIPVSSDHSERLRNKRLSLASDGKKLLVSGYHSDVGHKKRASVAGTLVTSRKNSLTAQTPMDVESSSTSELEDSEVGS